MAWQMFTVTIIVWSSVQAKQNQHQRRNTMQLLIIEYVWMHNLNCQGSKWDQSCRYIDKTAVRASHETIILTYIVLKFHLVWDSHFAGTDKIWPYVYAFTYLLTYASRCSCVSHTTRNNTVYRSTYYICVLSYMECIQECWFLSCVLRLTF